MDTTMTHAIRFVVAAVFLVSMTAPRADAVMVYALPGSPEGLPWAAEQQPAPPAPPALPAAPDKGKVRVEKDKEKIVIERHERNTGRRAGAAQEAVEDRSFKVEREATVSVTNLSGDVVITVEPGSEVKVHAVKRAWGTKEEAASAIEGTTVEMEQRGTRIEIGSVPRSRSNAEVAFSITVPPPTIVEVKSMSGDVTLKGIKGDARAETLSGDIVGRELGALSAVRTMSGDIYFSGCTAANEVTVGSVSGDVNAQNLKARSCSFSSVSGDMVFGSMSCERAAIRSAKRQCSGGPLERGGRCTTSNCTPET